MQTIKLQSSDGEIFDVDVNILKCSGIMSTMIEYSGSEDNVIVPLPKVNSVSLRLILTWADYHRDDHDPQPTEVTSNSVKKMRADEITPWDADLLKVDQDTLLELMVAANYMDIDDLVELTCKTVANMINDKTTEEIRDTFHIQEDFSSAEEEQAPQEGYEKM